MSDLFILPLNISERGLTAPFLIVEEDNLLVLGRNRDDSDLSLKKMSLQTGEIQWEIRLERDPYILAFDNSMVFLGANYGHVASCDTTHKPSCAGVSIAAYDVSSGQKIWSNVYVGLPDISQMFLDDSGLIVNGSGSHCAYEGVFTIDPVTGLEHEAVFREGCLGVSASMQAPDPFDLPFGLPQGSDISFADKVSSNFAVGNGIVFVLTTDAELWAFDKETKEVRGILTFIPDNLPLEARNNSWLVANKSFVVVYFQDTMQLFGYRFSPNDE